MSVYTHRLGEEVSDALLQARRVVVMLFPGDQGERVQNLHDDLKKIGRSNLYSDYRYIPNLYICM